VGGTSAPRTGGRVRGEVPSPSGGVQGQEETRSEQFQGRRPSALAVRGHPLSPDDTYLSCTNNPQVLLWLGIFLLLLVNLPMVHWMRG
jgi:hypothetical protein